MDVFIEVLKLLGVSILPAVTAFIIYIINRKITSLKYVNTYIKQIIIGFIFSCTALASFYLGMKSRIITDYSSPIILTFGPMNASAIISGVIFGWPAGLTTGVIGFIWRMFASDIHYVGDFLRYADAVSLLVSSGLGILYSRLLFKKKTPKWTFGILIALVTECVHLLITFYMVTLINKNIDIGTDIVKSMDWKLMLAEALSLSLTLLFINLVDKQKINPFKRNTKLSGTIQRRLSLFFAIAMLITVSTTAIASVAKASADAEDELVVAAEDVCNELIETTELYGIENPPESCIQQVVANRRIRSAGFITIVSAKEITLTREKNSNDDPLLVTYPANTLLAVPSKYSTRRHSDFYFNNDPNQTAGSKLERTLTFKDPNDNDITCQASYFIECSIFDNIYSRKVNHLAQIIKISIDQKFDFYVCSFLSVYEAQQAVGLSMRLSLYFEVLVFALAYVLIYIFIRKRVVNNIDSVNASLSRISAGKLKTVVNVRDYEEFASLSDDINKTVDVLKGYIKEANKRIDDELKYAKTIQMNSIPLVFPVSKYFDLHASMITAKQVGGDFYDFFFIDDAHLFFMVADVSGKGIPAAMFMMRAKTLVNALAQTKELTLDHIIDNVNDELNVDNKSGMFVTAWFGLLDLITGKLEYVNGGHTLPVIKSNKNVRLLTMKPNMVLGVFPNVKYELEKTYLKKDDQIVIYTDGVTEATNKKKKLYGEKRLVEFMRQKFTSSYDTVDKLNKELAIFQKGVEQADDITILSLIYKGKVK